METLVISKEISALLNPSVLASWVAYRNRMESKTKGHFIFGCHVDALLKMLLYRVDRHANVIQVTFSYSNFLPKDSTYHSAILFIWHLSIEKDGRLWNEIKR